MQLYIILAAVAVARGQSNSTNATNSNSAASIETLVQTNVAPASTTQPGAVYASPVAAVAQPPTAYVADYSGNCVGVDDNNIVCKDPYTFWICASGLPSTETIACDANTYCCGHGLSSCLASCDGSDSNAGATPAAYASGWQQSAVPTGYTGGYPAASSDGPYSPSIPLYTYGPKPDFCDEQANDWSHQGKFCVGTRSNMWCDNGEISRLNFCPSDQICCEQTGECGHPSHPSDEKGHKNVGCYTSKNIPRRTEGCRSDRYHDCDDVSDGARVCTGANTFSYCLDQKVFAFAGPMTCPEGYMCCPNLGGRCEEDCNYPTQPVGGCNDQPDGATVCSGYKSYKVCHNGGCLGTFDCVGDDMVCCPMTGACAKKAACDSHAFWPTTDDACYGFLNKRVCTPDGLVNICLAGHVVAKFPADSGYDFGCDNDGKNHAAKAGYGQTAPGYGSSAPSSGSGNYWLPTTGNGYSKEAKYN